MLTHFLCAGVLLVSHNQNHLQSLSSWLFFFFLRVLLITSYPSILERVGNSRFDQESFTTLLRCGKCTTVTQHFCPLCSIFGLTNKHKLQRGLNPSFDHILKVSNNYISHCCPCNIWCLYINSPYLVQFNVYKRSRKTWYPIIVFLPPSKIL